MHFILEGKKHTLANGQERPLAIGVAGDGLDWLAAGKTEARVALIRGGAAEADVGGGDGEPVINLRHGAAVHLLALGDVGRAPAAARHAEGVDAGDAGGEDHSLGAQESGGGAEDGVDGGADGTLAGDQLRAVGGEDGAEAGAVVGRVRLESDHHLARAGAEHELGRLDSREAGPGVEAEAAEAIVNLQITSVLNCIPKLMRARFSPSKSEMR